MSTPSETPYDLAIIGGGINGCGIARDAAGRGLKVFLCEQYDLASGTSSAATKLIHGGLRYLEYYEFGLVRKALLEREVLLKAAPHIIRPMRFVLPHHKGLRPAWLLRLGLFLYDHIGGRKILPGTKTIDLRTDEAGKPLVGDFTKAFEYSDCWVEDARLVSLNARDAQAHGADIRTRTECLSAKPDGDMWALELQDKTNNSPYTVQAKAMINASGPWVSSFLNSAMDRNPEERIRMVQGSHIVVKRLFDHDRAYFFQNADGRLVFAIPYEHDFTLIGTTDRDYEGDPADVTITPEETTYLCSAASEYFKNPISPADVVYAYSGVRPLYDDGASEAKAATRDYVLKLRNVDGLPLLNIYGGKLTTYRRLAEQVLEHFEKTFPRMGAPWTAEASLPGGDFPVEGFELLKASLSSLAPSLNKSHIHRLARLYGTEAHHILEGVEITADLGQHFGADLYEREVRHLMTHEWAQTAQDVLWRRTKLGLRLTDDEATRLDDWMTQERAKTAAKDPAPDSTQVSS